MNDERLPELFEEAAALDGAERLRLLARVRDENPSLARELERLLSAGPAVASPIDQLPWAGLPGESGSAGVPERVGAYRIVREIGRGGMGRVYLAEQETPDFRRTVALKLIDRPGSDADDIRRFRDEVRILASLDHPGIVRFLDGGRSPEGVWFLALEFVEGEHLLAHCERHQVDLRGRLDLFRMVLDAVAHAHRSGIVHRDLKPANILLGIDHRPRLLDFGISKLLAAGGTDDSVSGRSGPCLTPAYASPEQLAGQTVTPASDVFSLGVVLHELLTGRRPFAPGTRGPAHPRRRIDAVCSKALRPEPGERYPDAGAFADALDRAVSGDAGRSPNHARRIAASVLGIAGVVAALLAWRWDELSARPADRAQRLATADSTRFPFDPVNPPPLREAERHFLQNPADVAAGAAWAVRLVRDERLDEARIAISRLRQLSDSGAEGMVDFAEAQVAIAEGEEQRALVLLTRALEGAAAAHGDARIGTFRMARGALLEQLGDRESGVAELTLAAAELRRAGDARPLYRALCDLAVGQLRGGALDAGEAALTEAVAVASTAGFEPVVAWTNLAQLHLVKGRPDLAEPIATALVDYRRRRGGADRGRLADALARRSAILRDLGREREAEPILAEAIAILRDSSHPDYLAGALFERALADMDDGALSAVAALTEELQELGASSRRRRPLGYARDVEARRAALESDLSTSRARFAEARDLFAAEGDEDLASHAELAWAQAELVGGEIAEARRRVDSASRRLDPATPTLASFFASSLRVRIDAAAGNSANARRELERMEGVGPGTASLSRRLAYASARAAVAAAEHREGEAAATLVDAIALARAHGRKLAELELRIQRSHLGGSDAAELESVEREARALGLLDVARRARSLESSPLGL